MKLHAIHIDHLLSFESFTWDGIDPHLNVIVGPNGSGKTNLFHALRAICDALRVERTSTDARWARARHRGSDADTISIALDIEFTTAREKDLLCTFLATVLCNQQEIQQTVVHLGRRNADPQSVRRFAAWVLEQVRLQDLSWLFRGQLVVTHAGKWGWQCNYESNSKAPKFKLEVDSNRLLGRAEHNAQTETLNTGALFVVWRNSLSEQARLQLINGLAGDLPEEGFPIPHLSSLPDWVSSQQGVGLQINEQQQIVDQSMLAPFRAFTTLAQITLKSGEYFGVRTLFHQLLEEAFLFTDNVRIPYHQVFATNRLLSQPFNLSSGEDLARFLFAKKNGNLRDRKQYTAIRELFNRMTRREFDVVVDPPNAEDVQREQPTISLDLIVSGRWGDIPLAFSGAGIAEALYLSAVVAGSTGQVVLLDEPAHNLHPPVQATLLDELLALARPLKGEGSQFLVSTHTPTLVPPESIDRVSRFT